MLVTGSAEAAVFGPFCELHAKAPAGQRGGWLSAAKRKPYDATPIAPRLWIGSKPPVDRNLSNVDIVTLCAAEFQPEHVGRSALLRCPIIDDVLDPPELQLVLQTSVLVAKAIASRQRVLVTCQQGRNRSAFVIAFALHQLTTMSGEQIVAHIKKHRANALTNPWFVKKIVEIVGDGRPKQRRRAS